MSNELKPCPFCKHDAEIKTGDLPSGSFYAIAKCKNCTASVQAIGYTFESDAIEEVSVRWNTRAERTCHLERIPYEPGEYEGMRCSVCKTVDLEMGVGPYCPGCGAKVVE